MAAGRWDMKHWQQGKVTLFQALGIHRGTVKYPPLEAELPSQVAKSQQPGTSGASGGNAGLPSGGSQAQNADLGKAMAAQQPYNWTGAQWDALNNIAMAESGWSTTATNSTSGAYGIPQSLPGSKMAAAGSDWKTNPATQIRWMLGYIQSTYGNPVNAWNFHLAHGWY